MNFPPCPICSNPWDALERVALLSPVVVTPLGWRVLAAQEIAMVSLIIERPRSREDIARHVNPGTPLSDERFRTLMSRVNSKTRAIGREIKRLEQDYGFPEILR